MTTVSYDLLIIGTLILAGYITHVIGSKTHLPRVTLLLLLGTVSGPGILNLIPSIAEEWFPFISHMALAMVGFLLGERFYKEDLKDLGKNIFRISIVESLITAFTVLFFLILSGTNTLLSILLAGIAPATAPAATLDVVEQTKARGPLSKTLLGVVAVDDIWGVMLFSISLVFVEATVGSTNGNVILSMLWQILGAVSLGIIIGIPMSILTGRIKKGEPTLMEALGFVFFCGGISLYLDVSYLLSCMVLGIYVANTAKHHDKPFREIKGILEPFLVIFFFLAGYSYEILTLKTMGYITAIYILVRILGKIIGGYIGARLSKAPDYISKKIGFCLIPQAGVALGMALLVKENLPEIGNMVLPIVVSSTIVFELVGPVVTFHFLEDESRMQSTD